MAALQSSRRVAIVTGGYGGIGGATRKELASQGFTAISLDIQTDPDDPLQYRCDISQLDALQATLERIEATHGVIEVPVNNAAVFHGKAVFDLTPELFDRAFAINVRAMFFASQHVARRLVDNGRPGAIVNVASAAGRAGSPYVDYGYPASGGDDEAFGKALRQFWHQVNAVARPGHHRHAPLAGSRAAEVQSATDPDEALGAARGTGARDRLPRQRRCKLHDVGHR